MKHVWERNCRFHSTGMPAYWSTDIGRLPDLFDFFGIKGTVLYTLQLHFPVVLMISEILIQEDELLRPTSK